MEKKIDVLKTIDEDSSKSKDHEAEIAKKIVKDLDEINSNDCKSQDPTIFFFFFWESRSYYFSEGNTSNFIDFIRIERFDSTIDSYLVNLDDCMKIKEK